MRKQQFAQFRYNRIHPVCHEGMSLFPRRTDIPGMYLSTIIDIDKILEDGEITVVNYALELGMCEATAFGLFFSLSFNNAVVGRPGTEFTRLPHYYYIDEFPILLHSDQEQMFTMFRQYNVSNMVDTAPSARWSMPQTTAV